MANQELLRTAERTLWARLLTPVARTAAIMSNREDRQVCFQADEDDVIRKVVHGQLSNISIMNARHNPTGCWELLEML